MDSTKALRDAREALEAASVHVQRDMRNAGRHVASVCQATLDQIAAARVGIDAALAHQAEHAEAGEAKLPDVSDLLVWAVTDELLGMSKIMDADLQDALVRYSKRILALATASPSQASEPLQQGVTDEMVNRFLCWKLPADFAPDCGISFKRVYNETSPFGPRNYEPVGTNLLTGEQARAMLEYVIGATPSPTQASEPPKQGEHVPVLEYSAEDIVAEWNKGFQQGYESATKLASEAPATAGIWKPTEQQILQAAETAGLWPNTVHHWIPAFGRFFDALALSRPAAADPEGGASHG